MPKRSLKKRPDGRYACRFKDVFFYGSTSDEALDAREDYRRRLKAGLREKELGITVAEYAQKWITIDKANVSMSTYNAYAHYLNVFCLSLGDIRMKDVTSLDIKDIYGQQFGKSGSYIRKFCATCKAMFESAFEDGLISRNPCNKAKKPDMVDGTHRALEPWERELVENMVGKHPFAIPAMLMLYAGLRRGEALAIDIDKDVDFNKGVILVRRSVAFPSNQPVLKSTKTKAGVREVPLFDPLCAVLKGNHGLAISSKSGKIASESAFNSQWNSFLSAMETQLNGCHKRWYGKTKEHKAIKAAGGKLPPWRSITIRTHDFRHSFCTMLYDANVDIKTAMLWMGHSDEKMILRVYAHLTQEKEKAATLSVTNLINERISSQNGSHSDNKST